MQISLIMRASRRWLLSAAVGLLALNAEAQIAENVVYDHYLVDLSEATPLRGALNRATPIYEGGQPFHGYTSWNVDWRFDWTPTPQGCAATRVRVRLDAKITLPKPYGGTLLQVQQLRRYVEALKGHELDHVRYGRYAARQIESRLLAMRDPKGCEGFVERVNESAEAIIQWVVREEYAFDQATRYGQTQGVLLVEEGVAMAN